MLKTLERPEARPKYARPRSPAPDSAGGQRIPARGDIERLTETGSERIAEHVSGDPATFLNAIAQQRGE